MLVSTVPVREDDFETSRQTLPGSMPIEQVFWLRTGGATNKNAPIEPAFPFPLEQWPVRDPNVLHSGASAAGFHRLPIAGLRFGANRRASQPPEGEGELSV